MRLFTFQPETVIEALKRGEPYVCDPTKATFLADPDDPYNEGFREAYDWLAREMETRIPKPKDVQYPAWAWFRHHGDNRKPDRRLTLFNNYREPTILELEVPDDEVLLTDFDLWHWVLNGWAYQSDEDYELNPDWEATEEEKLASWQIIFDVDSSDFVQACIWTIKPEHVIRVHRKRPSRGTK